MALIHPSWTRDTTEKLGDGATYELVGAAITIAGVTYRLPAAVFALGDQSDWVVSMAGEWERIRATVSNLDPFTITRDLTWESTNNDQPVNWQSGTKDIYVVFGADVALLGAANLFQATQTIRSEAGGTGEGPAFTLFRDNPSPSGADNIGTIYIVGKNASDQTVTYGKLRGHILDAATNSEDFEWQFFARRDGAEGVRLRIKGHLVDTLVSFALLGNFLYFDPDFLSSLRSTDGQTLTFRVNSNDRLQLTNQVLRLLGIGLEAGAISASSNVVAAGSISGGGDLISSSSVRIRNNGDRALWLEDASGQTLAVLWHVAGDGSVRCRRHVTPGGAQGATWQLGPNAGQFMIDGQQVATTPVNRAQLKTSTTSQAGSIGLGSNVLVTMDPYSFWPRFEGNIGLRFAPQQGEGSVDSPQFRIVNDTGSSQGYAVRWRRIDA